MSLLTAFLFGFLCAFIVSALLGGIIGMFFFRQQAAEDDKFWNFEKERGDRDEA